MAMRILTINDIIKEYGLPRDYVYSLLKTKGCPVLPKKSGEKFRVIQDEFEKWLRGRTA